MEGQISLLSRRERDDDLGVEKSLVRVEQLIAGNADWPDRLWSRMNVEHRLAYAARLDLVAIRLAISLGDHNDLLLFCQRCARGVRQRILCGRLCTGGRAEQRQH